MATGAAGHRGGPGIEPVGGAQAAVSDDDKTAVEAAAAVEAEAPAAGSGRFVQYLGPRNVVANADELRGRDPRLGEGTRAEIGPLDWSKAGFGGVEKTLVWSLFNNYRVPAAEFTDEQLQHLLSVSKRFELVDSAGNKIKR